MTQGVGEACRSEHSKKTAKDYKVSSTVILNGFQQGICVKSGVFIREQFMRLCSCKELRSSQQVTPPQQLLHLQLQA